MRVLVLSHHALDPANRQKLRELAGKRGVNVADLGGELIEKTLARESPIRGRKKFSNMSGMFYGGDENTAERAPEILRAELGENSRGSN